MNLDKNLCVCYKNHLNKLEIIGICGVDFRLFKNYLTNGKQFVTINNVVNSTKIDSYHYICTTYFKEL